MTYQIIQPNQVNDHKSTGFISIYKPIAGWKAIQYWWNPDMGGFWEPYQTGMCAWNTQTEAELDAKLWAEAEEIPYMEPSA